MPTDELLLFVKLGLEMGALIWAAATVVSRVTMVAKNLDELKQELHGVRREMSKATEAIHKVLSEHGDRIARIEGSLRYRHKDE